MVCGTRVPHYSRRPRTASTTALTLVRPVCSRIASLSVCSRVFDPFAWFAGPPVPRYSLSRRPYVFARRCRANGLRDQRSRTTAAPRRQRAPPHAGWSVWCDVSPLNRSTYLPQNGSRLRCLSRYMFSASSSSPGISLASSCSRIFACFGDLDPEFVVFLDPRPTVGPSMATETRLPARTSSTSSPCSWIP